MTDLNAWLEAIGTRANLLDHTELLARAAEPDMNVLVLHADFFGEVLDRDSFVTGSAKSGNDLALESAAASKAFRSGGFGNRSGSSRLGGGSLGFSSPARGSFRSSRGLYRSAAGISGSKFRFDTLELFQQSFTLFS